ncbi:hypothetical protein EV121DRAFT_298145 [Schizophyllum commune]
MVNVADVCSAGDREAPGISPAMPPGSARYGRRPPELTVRAFPSVVPPPAACGRD